MPSGSMRRSTRVFVPKSVVKDADDARVLRSGKRFSIESGKGKPTRDDGDEEWLLRIENGDAADVPCYESDSWDNVIPEQGIDESNSNVKHPLQESAKNNCGTDDIEDKMHGIYYLRKRRRLSWNKFDSNSKSKDGHLGLEDRMYGIPFVRKHQRKRSLEHSLAEFSNRLENPDSEVRRAKLDVVVESSCDSILQFTRFLVSVLNFMRSSRIRLSGLTAFTCSEPIAQVFSKHGVHFLPDLSCRKKDFLSSGICRIFRCRQFVPIFSLEFSMIPLSFMNLHFSILFRSLYLPDILVKYLMELFTKAHGTVGSKKCLSYIPTESGFSGRDAMGSMGSTSSSVKKRKVNYFLEDTSLAGRSVSTRHRANSWKIHKRARSSMNMTRRRNPSSMGLYHGILHSNMNTRIKIDRTHYKMRGAVGANLFGVGHGYTSLSTLGSNHKMGNNNVKELKSTLVEVKQNMDSMCCDANILVIESDRCYREEGAKVTFECLASNDWYIVVKRHGLPKYMHKAEHEMRPNASNRFTHAMIWKGENGWKLEFSNKRDWLLFKELHKECVERNVKAASARTIPVPGVQEVVDYGDGRCASFVRPNVYITVNDDEVARALARKTANYDLDMTDEEWLEKLNNGVCDLKLSAEKFEEMIDELEKVAYYRPDDVFDENKVSSICSDPGSREIFDAVYQYWLRKRKQQRVPLLRVFQCPRWRTSKFVQEPVSCEKKSFKKQTSQSKRGKQRSSMKALAVEEQVQDAMLSTHRIEEARRSADISMELAILKRKRAQRLMGTADLATYKAAMALKIAEASQLAETPEHFGPFILS